MPVKALDQPIFDRPMTNDETLARFNAVTQALQSATRKVNRPSEQVQLLAVSKTKPVEQIEALYAAGQRQFGENYVQEAVAKVETLSHLDIVWHFIGPIQSNKTRLISEHFAWVHSVDRLKIAQRLSEQRPSHLPPLNICIQVNISEEASKSGCLPQDLDALLAACAKLPNLCLRGLMAIPAAKVAPEVTQADFAKMKSLLDHYQSAYPSLDTLSMGMSSDMELAIAEGSTMIRIGTALFGARS